MDTEIVVDKVIIVPNNDTMAIVAKILVDFVKLII
jgi:hypothetical protein